MRCGWDKHRGDFPLLNREVNGRKLIYLDNAATTPMPRSVVDAMSDHIYYHAANVHRGAHTLSSESTGAFEGARGAVADYINAGGADEVIFTSGTTQAVNLVARSLSECYFRKGDKVVVTEFEHHSNFVPWQEACKRAGCDFVVVPASSDGNLDMEKFKELAKGARLVAVALSSNVTGLRLPVEDIVDFSHREGALVLVDAAQAMRHEAVDVTGLGCDFLCFSGHKMFGPTGIGVLYGRSDLLDWMTPASFGGGMVDVVCNGNTSYGQAPVKFEAGTPNITGAVGLSAAMAYTLGVGRQLIADREIELYAAMREEVSSRRYVQLLPTPPECCGCLSFNLVSCHSYDVAKLLDGLGVAVRSGHHCAQPLLRRFGVDGCVRVSTAFMNDFDEVAAFCKSLDRVARVLGCCL